MPHPPLQYDFGSNWWGFVQAHLTDERIHEARASLREFLHLDSLAGLTFLDLGCGSGLFSLAALQLGADRVVSIDINPNSVRCAEELRRRAGDPGHWVIREGSVLDPAFLEGLGRHDIVYSWGVLHHTGDMWRAIRLAAERVRDGGWFWIAIYNTADGIGLYGDGRVGNSRVWEREKRLYVGLPRWGQRVVDYTAAAGMVLGYLVTFRNPVREIRGHKTLRGMSWMVDIRDWLGGYPYEHATVEELFRFGRESLGLELENLRSFNSLRCNEYLFRRPEAAAAPAPAARAAQA